MHNAITPSRQHALSLALAMALNLAAAVPAQATHVPAGPSSVLQCFYECKANPVGTTGTSTYKEITTLMIANGNQPTAATGHSNTHLATLIILDGKENVVAVAPTPLSSRDLDEVNICATLRQLPIAPPPAGSIQVAITRTPNNTDGFGVDIWMKNVVGKMQQHVPEPFNGQISDVGKTGCRNIEPEIVTAKKLLSDPAVQIAPQVRPVLIENTADQPNPF